jgi:hypothetical protein
VLCLGTEDRQSGNQKIASSTAILPFVSFPGNEIKDLYVHEQEESGAKSNEKPSAKSSSANQRSSASSGAGRPKQQYNNNTSHNNNSSRSHHSRGTTGAGGGSGGAAAPGPAAGTGEHLLRMRERSGANNSSDPSFSSSSAIENPSAGEFDFETALTSFKKEEVLAEVAQENSILAGTYIKDNFFDTLSSSVDSETSRKERMTNHQERVLNQDTFGAIALQQQNSYHHRRYGGRGQGGQGQGRGGYHQQGGGYRHRGNGNGGGYQQREQREDGGNEQGGGRYQTRGGRGGGYSRGGYRPRGRGGAGRARGGETEREA